LADSFPDTELVGQAQAGNVRSFSLLCEKYRHRVWRIASSVAHGPDAEDVAQEAILRAFRALSTYGGHAPFDAWLCRITLNVAHEYHRSAWKRRVVLFDQMPAGADANPGCPAREAEQRDLQRRVRQEVARLPEAQRAPIWLHFFEGFSVAEIARLERAPEATVRSRVRAGLKRLSLSLDDLLPPDAAIELLEPAVALEAEPKGCGA
jgi:RNA polymerase sigma-70 factor (ECF subfamily)